MKPNAILGLCLLAAIPVSAQQPPTAAPAPAATPSPGAPAAAGAGDDLKFPARVEQVNVDVVVTDKNGQPLRDLKADEFTVLEDGAPQAVSSFEAVAVPEAASTAPPPRPRVSSNTLPELQTGRTFVVLFDDIHLSPFQAARAKAAVVQFLTNGVREGDRVTLVSSGGSAWWSTRMEAGRPELLAMVKRFEGRHIPDRSPERMSDYEAMRIHVYNDKQVEDRVGRRFENYGVVTGTGSGRQGQTQFDEPDPYVRGKAADVYFQSVSRNRITLQVLDRVLSSLGLVKGRKSVILVSEGFIYDPNLDDFKKVVQSSRRANAAIYFLDTRGLEGLPFFNSAEFGPALDTQDLGSALMDSLNEGEGSESLASDSGGFTVKNTNDLGKGIQRIADESRSYYLLGYNPSNAALDGRFRKIEVKVARKGVKVRARRGYYAPLAPGLRKADDKKGGPDPDVQAALDSPYEREDVPMRMTDYIFDETLLGKARVLVATDVDVRNFGFKEEQGRFKDTLEFLLVVAHRETGEFFRYDQKVEMNLQPATRDRLSGTGYPVVKDFELAPGGYQAKMVVRDANNRRLGTIVHEFEVPDLTKWRVSTPIISDTLQPAPAGSKEVPRPAVLARRVFAAGSTLYCQFEVYGAAKDPKTNMPKVSAGYVIQGKDGTVVAQVAPSVINPTSLGKLSRLTGTGLQGAAPGEYELVLSLKDEIAGQTMELREPFSIQPPATASGGQ